MLNLEMSRIKDYLKIIAEKDGIQVCNDVAEYVFVVLAQFLQIVVSFPCNSFNNSDRSSLWYDICMESLLYNDKQKWFMIQTVLFHRCITTSTRVVWTWWRPSLRSSTPTLSSLRSCSKKSLGSHSGQARNSLVQKKRMDRWRIIWQKTYEGSLVSVQSFSAC